MKLESLKSSKFEAFKGTELQNTFMILGGTCYDTIVAGTGAKDWVHDDTKKLTGSLGNKYDDGGIVVRNPIENTEHLEYGHLTDYGFRVLE
jgi:hypothetical protein